MTVRLSDSTQLVFTVELPTENLKVVGFLPRNVETRFGSSNRCWESWSCEAEGDVHLDCSSKTNGSRLTSGLSTWQNYCSAIDRRPFAESAANFSWVLRDSGYPTQASKELGLEKAGLGEPKSDDLEEPRIE